MKNDIIDKSKLNELSPYDDSCPIMLLSNAFETQIEGVNEILDNIGEWTDERDKYIYKQ